MGILGILKAFSGLWGGVNSKIATANSPLKCPACGLMRPKNQTNCDCQESNASPIKVKMVQDKQDGLIAKLSLTPGGRENLIKNLSAAPSYQDKNKITLVINSRTTDTCYNVIFVNYNGIINIKCDCPAGELTKLCWHKLALVRGDSSMLADFCDPEAFRQVQKWFEKSPFMKLIADHDKAQEIVSEGQKVLKKLKANIEAAMRQGA